jgi:hypothetical protein
MAGYTGMYSLADLQGATAVGQISDADVAATLQAEADALNAVMTDQMRELAEITQEREGTYGTGAVGVMNRADDFARAHTQKGRQTGQVAYPFHKWVYATGWTNDFRRKASPAKYAEGFIGARTAYTNAFAVALREALFRSANYNFVDYMDTKLTLPVKRLLNADSAPVPLGPNGETFTAATHTHYTFSATLTDTAARALVSNIVEHGNGRRVRVFINVADVPDWQAGFVSAQPANVILGANTARTVEDLDVTRANNRFVGVYEGIPVWTKPWLFDNYALAIDLDANPKPLAVREDVAGSRMLGVEGDISLNPLNIQYYVARFGVGVRNRAAAAVLYHDGGAYTDPL